ncbi:hypothetical protein RSAG8_03713, partial [Rhizoctonia solani AG-8 WAC10335]
MNSALTTPRRLTVSCILLMILLSFEVLLGLVSFVMKSSSSNGNENKFVLYGTRGLFNGVVVAESSEATAR